MSTAHSVAVGMLMAIGLLSVAGFIQMLLLPFDIAARVLISIADANVRASDAERIYGKQMDARIATAEMLKRGRGEVRDGSG